MLPAPDAVARTVPETTRYMVALRRDSAETGVQDQVGNLLEGRGKYLLSADQRYVYFWFNTGRR